MKAALKVVLIVIMCLVFKKDKGWQNKSKKGKKKNKFQVDPNRIKIDK